MAAVFALGNRSFCWRGFPFKIGVKCVTQQLRSARTLEHWVVSRSFESWVGLPSRPQSGNELLVSQSTINPGDEKQYRGGGGP